MVAGNSDKGNSGYRIRPIVREQNNYIPEWKAFLAYLTDLFVYLNDWNPAKTLDDGGTKLPGVPTEGCKSCEEVEYGRVVVSTNERKRCVKNLF